MTLLEWFNSHAPPSEALLSGVLAAFVLMILLGLFRRVLLGILVGGIGGAVIAYLVAEFGGGDTVGLVGVSSPVIFGPLGAVAGGIAAWIGKRLSPDDPI